MNILMTGCCHGLGDFLYRKLEAQGHVVTGIGLNGPHLKVDFRSTDLELLASLAFNLAESEGGPVDVLINNAGMTRINFAPNHSLKDFEDVMRVNLTVPFVLMKEFVRRISFSYEHTLTDTRPPYRIVNTSSMGARFALRASPAYCASKAGLEHMTRSLAKEQAGKIPLMACCVAPNGIEGTPMTDYVTKRTCETRGWTKEYADKYNVNTPLGRLQTLEELWSIYDYAINQCPVFYTGTVFTSPGGAGL